MEMEKGKWKRVESAGTLVRGVNVRRDGDVWRAAGVPKVVRGDSWRPLQRLALPEAGCEAVMMRSGNLLGVIVGSTADGGEDVLGILKGEVAEIGQISGEPLRFDVVEPGVVRVLMKHSRTCYATYSIGSGGKVMFAWHGYMPELPPMALMVDGEVTMSETVGSTGLSGAGIVRNSLGDSDLATVTGRLLGVYGRLKRRAESAGYFVQPTIARYRLMDGAGDTIAVSAPVAVGSSTGFQCCGEIAFTSGDGLATLGAGALSARVYRLRLMTAGRLPAPWNRIVKEVAVETLPPLEPVDEQSQCTATATASGSSAVTVKVRLPGVPVSDEANAARRRGLVISALDDGGRGYGKQGCVAYPYDAEVSAHAVGLHPLEPQGVRKQYAPRREAVSYGACGTVGEMLVLADRREEGFGGYCPLDFMVHGREDATASWQCAVSVTIMRGDGSRSVAVAAGHGKGLAVEGLSPLLVYPDAAAKDITVSVSTEIGGVKRMLSETFPLTALPSTGVACYVPADVRPFMPRGVVDSIVVPEPSVGESKCGGRVEFCRPLHLSEPLTAVSFGNGAVVAVAEAPRSRATWDFARHKVLLMGADGIRVVAIDKDGAVRSSALLDDRPVARREAVCVGHGDNGLELLAVAGGDLVSVSQSAVKTMMRACRGEVPGWCGAYGEVWMCGGSGALRRFCRTGGVAEVIEVSLPGSAAGDVRFVGYAGRLLVSCGEGLLDTSEECFPEAGVQVGLKLRHDLRGLLPVRPLYKSYNGVMPGFVRLWLLAASVSGYVAVAGDRGAHGAQCLSKLKIDGALNAPVAVRLMAPLREWLETCVDALTSGDAEWLPIEILYRTQK